MVPERSRGVVCEPATVRSRDHSLPWIEEIIAWDEDTRWAWTVTRASVPLANAQVESFDLLEDTAGTRVRWTLALEPRLLARLGSPFTAGTVRRLFDRAMRNLGAHLARLE